MMDERERLGRVVQGFAPPDNGGFERLVDRRGRKQRNQRIRAGALGVIVALAVGLVLARSLRSEGVPANPPVEPTPAPTGVSGALAYALDGDIYVADPDGSNAVKIAARGTGGEGCVGTVGYELPTWSPDGSYLAYQRVCSYSSYSDPSGVVIVDPDGSVVGRLPSGTSFSPEGWSPDSTRLAAWETSERTTIGLYGVDGTRHASLTLPSTVKAAENGPQWMSDGSALLVFGYQPASLLVVPLDGSPARELSGGLQLPSPDGTRIAVLQDDAIVITDADGAPVSEVDQALRGAEWSPDGARLVSVSRRGDLVVVDPASGKVKVLTEAREALSEGDSVNTVRGFSPQGDRILYAALVRSGGAVYNSLYSIGVDGSDARLLVDGAMQGQWRPR